MKNATPEQQKAGMDMWMKWGQKAASATVDMDAPLGKTLKVTKSGDTSEASNDLGGYSILQAASKKALAKTLEGHPHFMMPVGSRLSRSEPFLACSQNAVDTTHVGEATSVPG